MSGINILWTEKYRPTDLEEMALTDENRAVFKSFIEGGEIPHLLLLGPAGVGKTTVAKILTDALNCQLLQLNASSERGIDTIRNKVGSFSKSRMTGDWNIVFLDEADAMTSDAQTALRNLMESYSNRTRFILTGNYGHKIIDPIKSRCQVLQMGEIPVKERYKILVRVLDEEGYGDIDPKTLLSYADAYSDIRKMLHAVQKNLLSYEELRPARNLEITGSEIFDACKNKRWGSIIDATRNPDFDARALLVDLFWAIPDDFSNSATWRAIVGKAVHESGFTPDPHVHFAGTCAEMISEL